MLVCKGESVFDEYMCESQLSGLFIINKQELGVCSITPQNPFHFCSFKSFLHYLKWYTGGKYVIVNI